MKRLRLPFLFFFFSVLSTYAQELFFSKPAAFQNLPSVETYQVLQDSKGYIWITTDGGLCRYDGTVLKTFTVKDGISENVVLKGCEDRKGRIWFSTLSGYFFYYENNRFNSIAANEEMKKISISYPVISFFIGDNDTLFCSTNSTAALIKIPPQGNYKQVICATKVYEKCSYYCYIDKKEKNKAVFGHGSAMDRHKDINQFNCNGEVLPVNNKAKMGTFSQGGMGAVDKNGNIYFAFGYKIVLYRKQTGKMEYYSLPYPPLSIYQDKDSDLWVGTEKGGGYLFKNSDLSKKPLTFLPSLTVCSVMLDRENSVWVATTQKGIFKSNNKELLMFPEKANYFQKDSNQLNIICKSKNIINVFKNDSLYTDSTFPEFILPTGEFRCGFIDKKCSYFSINGTLLYKDKSRTTPYKNLPLIGGKEIFKIGGDTICIVSSSYVILVYKDRMLNKLIPTFSPSCFIQLKNKTILLGSWNSSGLYELKNNAFIPYMPNVPQLRTRVNCIVEDNSGNLWFATNEHGLYCVDTRKKLHIYNSLVSDKLNSIVFDDQSNLWAITNNELIKFDFSNGLEKPLISVFDHSSGLPNFQLQKLTAFNGYIWCGTNEQFFRFKSNKLTLNKVPPLIYIDEMLVNSKSIHDKEQLLKLKYNESNIRILSTVITNKNTDKREFLYKLEGYDNNWHFSTIGDIQYNNLNPGNYRFIIYGLNNNRIKSSSPAEITFVIEQPFWYTWWFIIIEICATFAAIYFYFKYWKIKIEKREHEKTLVNQKIAEFKMTALRAQMNPHFIFNAIGSIQHYILKNEVKQSYNYLSTFSMLIRNILNNSGKEYISIDEEISVLKLYIELEQIRFTNPFKFVVEIDEQLDMETDIPTMLIQPYVENSIWHGLMPKETEGLLSLIFKKEGSSVHVIIRDNGVGRNRAGESPKNNSKGMSITAQRIETLEAANQRKFVVSITDLKDENNNPAGTEVHLIIPID